MSLEKKEIVRAREGKTGLAGRNFILVLIGQIISLFGNTILRFALPLYILDQSGSAALFGLVSAFAFLPMIIMSPVGGIIADRVNKQRIMVVLDFCAAALVLGFILLGGRVEITMLVVVVMMILYGIQGCYTPAVQASIPLLIREENLLSANAAINLVNSFSALIGPVIGGLLYASFGLLPIVTVGAVSFAVSAVMELFIRIPHVRQPLIGGIFRTVKQDMGESLRFMTREKPILMKAILVIFAFNLTMSSLLIIGLPVIITQTLQLGSKLYGLTQGLMAAGGLLGGLLTGLLGKRLAMKHAHLSLAVCALAMLPMGIVLYAGAAPMVAYIVISAMSFLAMTFATMFTIQLLSFAQMETPVNIVGKVISCLMALSMCAQPIGQSIYGLLFERFAAAQWGIVIISALISLGIALYSRLIFSQMKAPEEPIEPTAAGSLSQET